MSDGFYPHQDTFQKIDSIVSDAMNYSMSAATVWTKYDCLDTNSPIADEWCLWSGIVNDIRIYGFGSLRINQTLLFIVNGIGQFINLNKNDTFYYAHINKLNDID